MALGSTRQSIGWLIAREALGVVAVGALVGAVLATGAGPIVARYLYGIAPYDAGVLLAAGGAMFVIALVAASVPAARAARVDPFVTLRSE
jgi:ABC-type antimicrobial peptide transport system permease subunit